MTALLLRFAPYLLANPAVTLWALLAAFGAGVTSGAGGAWYVQGLRLTAAQQDLAQLKLDTQAAVQQAENKSDKVTKEVNDALPKYVEALHDYYRHNPVIRMLPPAAGKGGPVPATPSKPGPGPADVVLAADDWARVESSLEACGVTTLMFVQLRDWAREQRRQSLAPSGG